VITIDHETDATFGVLLDEVDPFFVSVVMGLLLGANTLDYGALGVPDLLALRFTEGLSG
jgi:hypothetical protein